MHIDTSCERRAYAQKLAVAFTDEEKLRDHLQGSTVLGRRELVQKLGH